MVAPSHFPTSGRGAKLEVDEEASLLHWDVGYIAYRHGSHDGHPLVLRVDDSNDSSNPPRPLSPTSMSDSSDDDEYVDAVEHTTNVTVDERHTSTRVIIRPLVRRASGFLGRLGRSSTPNSTRPSTPSGTRPSSPLGFNFGALNCFHTCDAFEREVDYLEEQSAKEVSGEAQVHVHVVKETKVQREELWREGVQQVLYSQRVCAALRSRPSTPLPSDCHGFEV